MNLGWKHLAGHLIHGTDFQKASAEEIDILLEEYPYFAGLHMLKVIKLHQIGSEELPAAASKAALYFPNPHWFRLGMEKMQHDLDLEPKKETAFVQDDLVETKLGPTERPVPDESDMIAQEPEPLPHVQEAAQEPPEQAVNWEHHLAENPVFQQHVVSDEEHYEQEIWHHQDTQTETGPVEEVEGDLSDTGVIVADAEASQEIAIGNPEAPTDEREPEILDEIPFEESLPENSPIETAIPEIAIEDEQEPEIPTMEVQEPELPMADVQEPEMATVEVQEPEIPQEEKEIHESVIAEAPSEPGPVPALPSPALDIPFEPLYTIDYFASQGIKVNQDAPPKDQLALKLRSFTEWLRAMKKINPEKMSKDFNQVEEDHIRVNAEVSNESHEIYTEAMAEVFLKQGKKDKAREVFEKLSLLDPSKSAYFAVRIKEIN